MTTPQVDADGCEVTAASASHAEDTSNLVKENVDRNNSNHLESIDGHERERGLGELNSYDQMIMKFILETWKRTLLVIHRTCLAFRAPITLRLPMVSLTTPLNGREHYSDSESQI